MHHSPGAWRLPREPGTRGLDPQQAGGVLECEAFTGGQCREDSAGRRNVGGVSLGGSSPFAISAPPLLAFCRRWPGPCRRVSTQPATLKYSPCHASSSDLGASSCGPWWLPAVAVPEVHWGPGMPPLFPPGALPASQAGLGKNHQPPCLAHL